MEIAAARLGRRARTVEAHTLYRTGTGYADVNKRLYLFRFTARSDFLSRLGFGEIRTGRSGLQITGRSLAVIRRRRRQRLRLIGRRLRGYPEDLRGGGQAVGRFGDFQLGDIAEDRALKLSERRVVGRQIL